MSVVVYGKTGVSPENRIVHDVYPTPEWAVIKAIEHLPKSWWSVVDAGAGEGIFGKHLSAGEMIGVELRDLPMPQGYTGWFGNTDYLTWKPAIRVDVVVGNPPYHLFEEFFWHTWNEVIHTHGVIAWVLPLKWLQGEKRYAKIFSNGHLHKVLTFVKRLDFTGKGSPHEASALYVWDRSIQNEYYLGGWID